MTIHFHIRELRPDEPHYAVGSRCVVNWQEDGGEKCLYFKTFKESLEFVRDEQTINSWGENAETDTIDRQGSQPDDER